MYPHERSLVKEMQGKPFALIGVNSDGNRDAIRKIVQEKNLNWRSFWNGPKGPSGPIAAAWNIRGWPTLYVLDEKGVIHYSGHDGNQAMAKARSLVSALDDESI